MRIEINKSEVRNILDDVSKKLLLIEFEKKGPKRNEIIDSILEDDSGEIHKLKKILGIKNEA